MKTVVGIIGPIGSGKDTAADYIADKFHIPHYQISQPLRDIAKERSIEPTRDNLITLGKSMAEEKGEAFLAILLLDKIESRGVITGIRQLAQIEYLKDQAHLILISIEADPVIRFNRAKLRGRLGEATTLKEFIDKENEENSGKGPQRLFECMKLANFHITNNTDSVEDLNKKIHAILTQEEFFPS